MCLWYLQNNFYQKLASKQTCCLYIVSIFILNNKSRCFGGMKKWIVLIIPNRTYYLTVPGELHEIRIRGSNLKAARVDWAKTSYLSQCQPKAWPSLNQVYFLAFNSAKPKSTYTTPITCPNQRELEYVVQGQLND